MCNSGCYYERWDGGCKGRPNGEITIKPHCFEEEDVESYNESVAHDKILRYELSRCDLQDYYDGLREESRISSR